MQSRIHSAHSRTTQQHVNDQPFVAIKGHNMYEKSYYNPNSAQNKTKSRYKRNEESKSSKANYDVNPSSLIIGSSIKLKNRPESACKLFD